MTSTNLNSHNNKTNGTTNRSTINNVYIFTDESGNVTQIKKQDKQRYKYYIDPELPNKLLEQACYIGVSSTEAGDCSYGIALGFGDNLILLAKYQ